MAPKPEDVMDLTDPSPKNIDVEYALRKTGVMVISGVWKQAEGVAYPVG